MDFTAFVHDQKLEVSLFCMLNAKTISKAVYSTTASVILVAVVFIV